jgi:two-component system, LuxR family, sensor kinase FixL
VPDQPSQLSNSLPLADYAKILDIAEDAIIVVDKHQRIVVFNHGAAKIFGYSNTEALGQPIELLMPRRFAASHSQYVEEFGRGTISARLMGDRQEVIGRRKDGAEFPAEGSICKFLDQGQQFFGAILRDVSERKQFEAKLLQLNQQLEERVRERTAELESTNQRLNASLQELQQKSDELKTTTQQLWQAAKLASVGELAASIAHELNNPLGTVSLRVESILGNTTAEDPRRVALEIVEQEVERMGRLVGNLLQFSRHGRDQVSTVNLYEEIRITSELTQHYLKRSGVEVHHDVDPQLPPLFADRQKLRQVFLNLFTNAGDAMPRGGKLVTRVRQLGSPAEKPRVLIEVSDTGTGIPAEILPHVMEPFFTTKEDGKGTGLGLAICKRIVLEHQGTIQMESEVGQGTTVRIILPIINEKNVSLLSG